ncbi:MAG TPA: hypothetical protein VHT02_04525 [Methylocella sp.]|jgi:hypothetical protein|nr:hypothetical protein [Methylocella sp.]
MGSLEANVEMVVMARNLPKDRIDFSMPGSSAREEIAITILLSEHQRAKIGEVRQQGPAIPPSLRRTDWQRMRENTASSEAGGSLRVQTRWWSPGGAGESAIGPNIVTSLTLGESL